MVGYSPPAAAGALVVFGLICFLIVYALSLAINKFDTCHQGVATVDGGDHSEEDLQWRKDYLSTILTIGIAVPGTLLARYALTKLTGPRMSALPLFSIAIGIMASIGCFWGTQIIKTQPVEESETCAATRAGQHTKGILWSGFAAGIVMALFGIFALITVYRTKGNLSGLINYSKYTPVPTPSIGDSARSTTAASGALTK